MLPLLKLLDNTPFINDYEILNYRESSSFQYIKIKAILTNSMELRISEYISAIERNYSYHVQTSEGALIIRWDNAHHHPQIDTHPHHKHVPEVVSSTAISSTEILKEMEIFLGL